MPAKLTAEWTVKFTADPTVATKADITAELFLEFTTICVTQSAEANKLPAVYPAETKFAFSAVCAISAVCFFPAACTKPTIAESAILTSDFPGAVSCYPDVDQISGR